METAKDNAANMRDVLAGRKDSIRLYRRVIAGPSGQRADKMICSVRCVDHGPYELAIHLANGPFAGQRVGYAARVAGTVQLWTVWEYDDNSGRAAILGWAPSVAIGADVLINGMHAATGRHDSARVSQGRWVPNPVHRSVYT